MYLKRHMCVRGLDVYIHVCRIHIDVCRALVSVPRGLDVSKATHVCRRFRCIHTCVSNTHRCVPCFSFSASRFRCN